MALPHERWPFVRSEWHRPEVDSTNSWASRLVAAGEIGHLPALVWTDRQTQGRGQGANTWWSDGGSLTASVVVDPATLDLPLAVRPRIALGVAAVVVAAVIEAIPGTLAGIRWPNDIEINGRKLGGILVEEARGDAGVRLIIGFGLNLATRLADAPGSIPQMAISLLSEPAPPDLRNFLLAAILRRFEPMLRGLAREAPDLVVTWNRLDTLFGTWIQIQVGTTRFAAIAEGIDASGGLVIRRDGQRTILHAGRILRD